MFRIPFNHVINAISECAFHNSQYPVILSIENHCSEDQQRQMANILKEVLGKKIYTENFGKETFQFPSPDSLRNQFLIRSRKLPTESQNDVGYVTDDDEGGDALIEVNHLCYIFKVLGVGWKWSVENHLVPNNFNKHVMLLFQVLFGVLLTLKKIFRSKSFVCHPEMT